MRAAVPLAGLGLTLVLGCTGALEPEPERKPLYEACTLAIDNARNWEGLEYTEGLHEDCRVYYGSYAPKERVDQLHCMAEADDSAQWRECRKLLPFTPTPPPSAPPAKAVPIPLAPVIPALTDEHQIISMIQRQMRAQITELRTCYEAELSTSPDLQGRWKLHFTVERAGTTRDIHIEPRRQSSPAMERCMAEHVAAWHFDPIATDLPVQKTVTFVPGRDNGLAAGPTASTPPSTATVVGSTPRILGSLEPEMITEVVKRHQSQLRYCYQRELTTDPSLEGNITIKFVIAKDGTVSSASVKSTTMNNSAVEQCLTGRFMRMRFPEPRGGGIVIVSYPFSFVPG